MFSNNKNLTKTNIRISKVTSSHNDNVVFDPACMFMWVRIGHQMDFWTDLWREKKTANEVTVIGVLLLTAPGATGAIQLAGYRFTWRCRTQRNQT